MTSSPTWGHQPWGQESWNESRPSRVPLVQIWMLSDEWLLIYELLENLEIKLCNSVTGTRTRTTGVTAIALLVLRTGELITDRGVWTIRNWPVIKIFRVRIIWIADKLPNISEDKKTWSYSFFLSRVFTVLGYRIFAVFSPDNARISELSRPDIGEHKFDGTVGQKLGVVKWKTNQGFWCSKK